MKFTIGLESDGWCVLDEHNNTIVRYNHDDEDLGAEAVKELLKYIGIESQIQEWY